MNTYQLEKNRYKYIINYPGSLKHRDSCPPENIHNLIVRALANVVEHGKVSFTLINDINYNVIDENLKKYLIDMINIIIDFKNNIDKKMAANPKDEDFKKLYDNKREQLVTFYAFIKNSNHQGKYIHKEYGAKNKIINWEPILKIVLDMDINFVGSPLEEYLVEEASLCYQNQTKQNTLTN